MKRLAVVVLALSLGLGGCTTLAAWVGDIAQFFSSSTPSQVSTLAAAVQADTLIATSIDTYVKTGVPSRAILLELQAIQKSLEAALSDLEAANTAGQSLDYAAFNAALAAFNSYATSQGISH
jgi:hypothetical protein